MAPNLPPVPLLDIRQFPYPIQEWFRQVRLALTGGGGAGVLFSSLDFTGSNLTSILTRNHDDLQNMDGGSGSERYHLTAAQHTLATSLAAGTYTPTLTDVVNLTSSTAFQCQYSRVGDTVTVSGKVNMQPTAGGAVELGMSLPIASNIGAEEDVGGTAACADVAGEVVAIMGDSGSNRASFQFVATDTSNNEFFFSFTYRVI